jgi:hypothetical protein
MEMVIPASPSPPARQHDALTCQPPQSSLGLMPMRRPVKTNKTFGT